MLLKDILSLEKIQRRATKFILPQTTSPMTYKERLVYLNILPLMYHLELADVMLFVNSYKNPSSRFNIFKNATVVTGTTWSSDSLSLKHNFCRTNLLRHFYYNRLPRLWNGLPSIDTSLSSKAIKKQIKEFLWLQFRLNFDSDNPCSFHFKCPCNKCPV